MILWVALFLLVVLISFILAYRSMRDFQLTPTKIGIEYGLYLIRNPPGLTGDILDQLGGSLDDGLIFSLERLFKGQRAALVIFGPKELLKNTSDRLNLLELEDYTQVDENEISGWEVGLKDGRGLFSDESGKVFENMPHLLENEQFWWQINLKAHLAKGGGQKQFLAQIRCILSSADHHRLKKLADQLAHLGSPVLTKIPKPFTSQKILQFYQKRTLTLEKHNLTLTSGEILQAVALGP